MFTWICPQCGREVPPSYTDCPDCAAKAAQPQGAATAQAPAGGPSPAPAAAAVPVAPVAAAPARPRTRAHGTSLPIWLLTILFIFAFVGIGAGVFWAVGYFRTRGQAARPSATVESPAAKPGAPANPLQKYIEVSAVRFVLDPKKKDIILAKFILTNHSEADITGLAGNVTVWGRTQKSEEDAQGTLSFTTNVGPYEAKEVTVPFNTKLKIYELPDWQNITTDVQITAPATPAGSVLPQ